MIGIIDYGMGNLKSVYNALKYLNIEASFVHTKEEMKLCDKLILPGVGSFKKGMENLIEKGLIEAIKEEVKEGKPLLGICLGMQLLFEGSEEGEIISSIGESEFSQGLNFIPGKVVRLKGDIKIPHMGWNSLSFTQEGRGKEIIKNLKEESYVYYVHSYYAEMDEQYLVAYSEYGDNKIPGIVQKENVIGAQFHPEKSSDIGLNILRNFVEGA